MEITPVPHCPLISARICGAAAGVHVPIQPAWLHPAGVSGVIFAECVAPAAPAWRRSQAREGIRPLSDREDDMRRFLRIEFATVAAMPRHGHAIALAGLLLFAPAAQAGGDQARDQSAELAAVTRELEAVKAELNGMKARVTELQGDIAQTRDALDTFREEAGRTDERATPALSATLTFPVHKDRATADVDVTGAIDTAPPLSAAEQKQLTKADELLGRGDVAGARLVLEHASGASPAAALKLGETYDPKRLAAWRVYGVLGDAAKARVLYQRAYAGGIKEARDRLAGLQ
jgi:hypothetical protein